jgi:hypothetical protein
VCGWCQEREVQAQVETQRLEELWEVRECAAPDCSIVFEPATAPQRFHADACRKRTHARLKARRRVTSAP